MSGNQALVTKISDYLKSSFPEVDEALSVYIAHILVSDDAVDANTLYDGIGQTLMWFRVVKSESEARSFCEQLLAAIYRNQIIPEPTPAAADTTDASATATSSKRSKSKSWSFVTEADKPKLVPGKFVLARTGIARSYSIGTIESITPDGSYLVYFTQLRTYDCVLLEDLQIAGEELEQKLIQRQALLASGKSEEDMTIEELLLLEDDDADASLANASASYELDVSNMVLTTPIRVADLNAEEKKEVKPDDDGISALEMIVTKKDLRAQQKEKRKMDLARQREIKRAEREQKQKEDALRLYLSNSQLGRSTAVDIHINGYNMTSPDGSRELLENATFSLNQGRRYGLIGSNGVGKTTLLKALANYEVPGVPPHLRILHVEQECRGDGYSALQTVLRADIEREILIHEEARLKKLLGDEDGPGNTGGAPQNANAGTITSSVSVDEEDNAKEAQRWAELNELLMQDKTSDPSMKLQQVYARMDAIDAWGAEARAANILAGLQFSPERMNLPTKSLSGGWRMRVSLACALFAEPDLLLLDEPTNHLDFPAVLWLENYLNSYSKTVVIISHDRMFLNNTITDVLHFYRRTLTCYKGDYTTFEKVREDQIRTQKRMFEANQAKIAHMQEFVDKNRFNANRAALVQSRLKTIKRIDTVDDVEEDSVFTMKFPSPGDDLNGQSAIEVNNITFAYPERDGVLSPPILKNVTVNISCNSRVGILGANGSGKTTLLNLILGKLEPCEGTIYRNGSARIAHFSQHHMDKLTGTLTPLEQLLELFPKNHPQIIRRHLGKFGVNGPMQTQVISSLSGGQKSRVAFAIMMWDKPHVIIMDEPTNHLDLETVDVLVGAVQEFTGGIVVVSHDQHFLSSVCKDYWAVAGGSVKKFDEFKDAKKFSYASVAGI